ncbi:hypothetical protein HYQ40_08890 [Aerococcaceae bacterium DSM 111021]|nr:hypothetical protein [Aerococcaceae bacterium DSM 111021]
MRQEKNKRLKIFLFVIITIISYKTVETIMDGIFLAFFGQDLSEMVANFIKDFLN